jgi:hypothetical protein
MVRIILYAKPNNPAAAQLGGFSTVSQRPNRPFVNQDRDGRRVSFSINQRPNRPFAGGWPYVGFSIINQRPNRPFAGGWPYIGFSIINQRSNGPFASQDRKAKMAVQVKIRTEYSQSCPVIYSHD